MRKLEKEIKLLHQGTGTAINIPKIILQLMGAKAGDKVKVEYDIEKEEMIIKKV